MKCINCGYITHERIKCPKCGGNLIQIFELKGEILYSWKLNVTPEGLEDSYYLNLVRVEDGKVLCKSEEKFKERDIVIVKNHGECVKYA
ncbi:hypothetical protein SJAV_10610 [Sulfurisphaera javensis]|uniref:Uncharacterized protein n=1 Tax=Sulfurisphaera javensis TaxID=2049879 RepID=A0AAT9GQP6_9CREN